MFNRGTVHTMDSSRGSLSTLLWPEAVGEGVEKAQTRSLELQLRLFSSPTEFDLILLLLSHLLVSSSEARRQGRPLPCPPGAASWGRKQVENAGEWLCGGVRACQWGAGGGPKAIWAWQLLRSCQGAPETEKEPGPCGQGQRKTRLADCCGDHDHNKFTLEI